MSTIQRGNDNPTPPTIDPGGAAAFQLGVESSRSIARFSDTITAHLDLDGIDAPAYSPTLRERLRAAIDAFRDPSGAYSRGIVAGMGIDPSLVNVEAHLERRARQVATMRRVLDERAAGVR